MYLNWNNRAWYISPGKGKQVKVTLTYQVKINETTSVFQTEVKQEFVN